MAASVGVLNPSGAPSIGGGATTGAFVHFNVTLIHGLDREDEFTSPELLHDVEVRVPRSADPSTCVMSVCGALFVQSPVCLRCWRRTMSSCR